MGIIKWHCTANHIMGQTTMAASMVPQESDLENDNSSEGQGSSASPWEGQWRVQSLPRQRAPQCIYKTCLVVLSGLRGLIHITCSTQENTIFSSITFSVDQKHEWSTPNCDTKCPGSFELMWPQLPEVLPGNHLGTKKT